MLVPAGPRKDSAALIISTQVQAMDFSPEIVADASTDMQV